MSLGSLIVSNEFFITGQPIINYKRFISKLYLNECLFRFFGFGKKKLIASIARECLNSNLFPNQVVEVVLKLYQQICSLNRIKHSTYFRIVGKFISSIPYSLSLLRRIYKIESLNTYDSMKNYVHNVVNDINGKSDLDLKVMSHLQCDNEELITSLNQVRKEKEILEVEISHLKQDISRKEKHISDLYTDIESKSGLIEFRNSTVVDLKKEKERLSSEMSSTKKKLISEISSLRNQISAQDTQSEKQKIEIENLKTVFIVNEEQMNLAQDEISKLSSKLKDLTNSNTSRSQKDLETGVINMKQNRIIQSIGDNTINNICLNHKIGTELMNSIVGSYKFNKKEWDSIQNSANFLTISDFIFRIFKVLIRIKQFKPVINGLNNAQWRD